MIHVVLVVLVVWIVAIMLSRIAKAIVGGLLALIAIPVFVVVGAVRLAARSGGKVFGG